MEAASSIGYIVALGKEYRQGGAFTVDEHERKVATLLPSCGGRTVKGYANLIWFTEQVCTIDSLLSINAQYICFVVRHNYNIICPCMY